MTKMELYVRVLTELQIGGPTHCRGCRLEIRLELQDVLVELRRMAAAERATGEQQVQNLAEAAAWARAQF